jgi:hypothetical protein
MDDVARAYIGLAYAIEQYIPGYIDGYFGPEALKTSVKRPLAELAAEAEQLAAAVLVLDDRERQAFLTGQVRAMQTSIALLQGESISYVDEVRRLYDVEPTKVPEHVYDEALAVLDKVLPGSGAIATREQALRAQFQVPPEKLISLIAYIVEELARRTRARFELPQDESFDVQLVHNQPWSGYNWYLGNNRSRIDINIDLPKYLTNLPDLIAHEAYPGHHTEHAIKDQLLYRDAQRGEHAILLINAPECVVSEGIATRALQTVMSEAEIRDWLANDLVERAGLRDVDLDTFFIVRDAKEKLNSVTENAALMLHQEHASEREVAEYIQHYGLARPEEAQKSLDFIRHPNFRSYIFTYSKGGELLDQLFERGDPQSWFARLLHEPVTPTVIREWIRNPS